MRVALPIQIILQNDLRGEGVHHSLTPLTVGAGAVQEAVSLHSGHPLVVKADGQVCLLTQEG